MTVPHDDDEIPWDPDEVPPDDEPDVDNWYPSASETAEVLDLARADDEAADEHALHHELEHLDAIPDNVRHLPRNIQIRHAISAHRAQRAADVGLLDLDAFLAEPDPEYDWLIPGLLERGDRVVLTGQEGKGKSTLLRQIGVQVAAGIHPFTLDEIVPKRVLLIDVENPRRLIRRALRPLRLSAGERLMGGYMIPVVWTAGLDLRRDEDAQRLSGLLDTLGTDLLITGPSYKLASGDPTTEETAKAVTAVLDQLRAIHDFALILEAHQPYAATAGGKRALRPYGASLWSRWPEFGLHLADGGTLEHWRGDRDQRDWPEALQRGGEWPWTTVTDVRGVTFARILDATRDAGRKLSHRELGDALGGAHHSTIGRAIKANQAQYDALMLELGEGDE